MDHKAPLGDFEGSFVAHNTNNPHESIVHLRLQALTCIIYMRGRFGVNYYLQVITVEH